MQALSSDLPQIRQGAVTPFLDSLTYPCHSPIVLVPHVSSTPRPPLGRVSALKAEALLNHSMLVMPPFEAFDCATPRDSKRSGQSGESSDPKLMTGKEAGVLASKGQIHQSGCCSSTVGRLGVALSRLSPWDSCLIVLCRFKV